MKRGMKMGGRRGGNQEGRGGMEREDEGGKEISRGDGGAAREWGWGG